MSTFQRPIIKPMEARRPGNFLLDALSAEERARLPVKEVTVSLGEILRLQ